MLSKLTSIQHRVYLQRVQHFFGNAIGNLISAIIGGFIIALVLRSGGTPLNQVAVWFSFILFFVLLTAYIEKQYRHDILTIQNAQKWVYLRSIAGAMIASMYGIAPFVFTQYLGIQEEMFLFIVLSAMVSIALVGYTVMPYYYILLNVLTLTPLTFYFFLHDDKIHNILVATAIIWQFLVISKGWRVSKASINAITLNEQLQDEIQHHKETKEKLHKLATHDTLTGIPNRGLLMENLESMFSLAHRNNAKIIIMFINLDGFKDVNDSYGHDAGDFLLKEVATRLKVYIRKSDTLARMGGDEFILGFMESDNFETLANRIMNSISAPILLPSGNSVKVGGSIGIALYPTDGESPGDLIKIADDRMYTSKVNGKNRYTFSD